MRPTDVAGAWDAALARSDPAERTRRLEHSRSREARARLARVTIAFVTFLLMLGGAWLLGTQPSDKQYATPEAKASASTRDADAEAISGAARTAGWIVQQHTDGQSCTYTEFDNATQWFGAPTTTVCDDVRRKGEPNPRAFSWGR